MFSDLLIIKLFALLFCPILIVHGQQLNNFIQSSTYQGLRVYGCSRILNNTRVMGCQGKKTDGIVKLLRSQQELDSFVSGSNFNAKYIAVIPYTLTNSISKLKQSGKVNGIVLMKDAEGFNKPDRFSSDRTCPQCQFFSNEIVDWNPAGTGLSFDSFDFPIFAMWNRTNDSYASHITALKQAGEFNEKNDNPLYAAELDGLMNAGTNSETCLRRRRCDPLGGYSIWSTFSLDMSATDDKKIIVVSSKLDSLAFIRELAIGASARTGIVAVMAIADALKVAVATQGSLLKKHILFTFFDAEEWAFAGSQKFIQDITMKDFQCNSRTPSLDQKLACTSESITFCAQPCYPQTYFRNISFQNIESMIELSSVGNLYNPQTNGLFLHSLGDEASASFANLFRGTINLGGRTVPIQPSTRKILPPSSIMSFLKKKSIPAVFISDYNDKFSNPYFHGEYDDGLNWGKENVDLICGIVNITAQAIWSLAIQPAGSGATVPSSVAANCTLIQELLDCVTRNISCSLMNKLISTSSGRLSGISQVSNSPSGITLSSRPSTLHYFIKTFMHNVTAIQRGQSCFDNINVCDEKSDEYCVAGQCTKSRTHYQAAYNPGIEFDYSEKWWKIVDSSSPIWTESRWDFLRMRIFKQQSTASEGYQLGVGLAMTVGCAFMVLSIRKRLLQLQEKKKST